MIIQYTNENQRTLSGVLENAVGNEATHVIPDLQRPYVWKPDQIILLVDSLFRRWPFGSILTWLVESKTNADEFGIPNRAFYRSVSRTDSVKPEIFGKKQPPETYTMILDGQQRLQSLILALASEDSSFTMDVEDWKGLEPSDVILPDVKKGPITARLYLDYMALLEAWRQSLPRASVSQNIMTNGIAAYLKWSASSKPGLILLSKLWNEAKGKETRTADDWIYDECIFAKYGIEGDDAQKAFAQLLSLIGMIRKDTIVPVLQIQAFREDEKQRNTYNDAIVNIFTRLNTAGRTLTKEEITLAWLKNGWQTGREKAEQELSELLNSINDKTGKLFEMDDLVRYLSFVWAVLQNGGKLIESKDLLDGRKIRPIAQYISQNIDAIQTATQGALEIVEDSKVLEASSSKNSLIVFMTWYFIVSNAFQPRGRIVDTTNAEKDFDEFCKRFLNRWIFTSQWSGEWNSSAQTFFADLANKLYSIDRIIAGYRHPVDLAVVKATETMLITDTLKDKAKNRVNTIFARKRTQVAQYRPMLWVWHRLDKKRWDNSTIQLLLPRKRTAKLEVDHAVAFQKWKDDILPKQVKKDNPSVPETALAGCCPQNFSSRQEAESFINSLGNMSLLNKSFNVAKSMNDMEVFLVQVKEFRDKQNLFKEWSDSLLLERPLTSPSQAIFADIVASIKQREHAIRSELLDFIDGKKFRCD